MLVTVDASRSVSVDGVGIDMYLLKRFRRIVMLLLMMMTMIRCPKLTLIVCEERRHGSGVAEKWHTYCDSMTI